MSNMIAVDEFDAKFVLNREDGTRCWWPCRVVGIASSTCGPQFIAMVEYPGGWIRAEDFHQVYAEDAEMPPK